MKHFLVLYETEATCLARLEAGGLTGEPAREIAAYLSQATDLAAFFDRIQAAFAPHGVEVHFADIGEPGRYLPLLQADPAACLVWNVTDGFRYYRGSLAAAAAALLGAPTFGSPPQAQHLCQDKYKCLTLAAALGIPAPPSVLIRNGRFLTPVPRSPFPAPLFVKPNTLGAKLGIWADSRCETLDEADALSRRIYDRYGDDALLQPYLAGSDLRVSFMDAAAPGEATRAGIYRLVDVEGGEAGGAFLTMADNWTLSASRSDAEIGVASPFAGRAAGFRPRLVDLRRDPAAAATVSQIEESVARLAALFDLRDVYSFDFRVTPDGTPYFLEFEVCPAVTIYDFQTYLEQTYGVDLPAALVRAVVLKGNRERATGNGKGL